MNGLLLVGGGGHCRSCIDVIEANAQYAIHGIVDQSLPAALDTLGYPFLGDDSCLPGLLKEGGNALVTVGQIRSADSRKRLFALLKSLGATLPAIVSPYAHVSRHAQVGEGTIVCHGAIINAKASVGSNGIVNSRALVEHDVIVGDHCHISTGALVNGGCTVGEGTFIGSGAIVHNGVNIGSGCVIAAGIVVKSDVPNGTLFRGYR